MFEKVNPSHPDKIADRIAGALVDMAYAEKENPKIAVEVLIGHGVCHIIAETSVSLDEQKVKNAVKRIAGECDVDFVQGNQDLHLAQNQKDKMRCGDNGIFKGVPLTEEQKWLSIVVKDLYKKYHTDGKYILAKGCLTACQSCARTEVLLDEIKSAYCDKAYVNPLGEWTGGTNVDTGATNRKLGSDMADGVTGGGLHGKDLSKADVSVNIYAFLKAQATQKPVELYCAIGDEYIDGKPYSEIVKIAREYIMTHGGFERFAEWGLV